MSNDIESLGSHIIQILNATNETNIQYQLDENSRDILNHFAAQTSPSAIYVKADGLKCIYIYLFIFYFDFIYNIFEYRFSIYIQIFNIEIDKIRIGVCCSYIHCGV